MYTYSISLTEIENDKLLSRLEQQICSDIFSFLAANKPFIRCIDYLAKKHRASIRSIQRSIKKLVDLNYYKKIINEYGYELQVSNGSSYLESAINYFRCQRVKKVNSNNEQLSVKKARDNSVGKNDTDVAPLYVDMNNINIAETEGENKVCTRDKNYGPCPPTPYIYNIINNTKSTKHRNVKSTTPKKPNSIYFLRKEEEQNLTSLEKSSFVGKQHLPLVLFIIAKHYRKLTNESIKQICSYVDYNFKDKGIKTDLDKFIKIALSKMDKGEWRIPANYVSEDLKNEQFYIAEHEKMKKEEIDSFKRDEKSKNEQFYVAGKVSNTQNNLEQSSKLSNLRSIMDFVRKGFSIGTKNIDCGLTT